MPGKWKRIYERAEVFNNRAAEYFLSAGVDYKGQAQTGYTCNGGGLSFNVKIDPGKCIGMKAELGVSASASRAKETMLIVHRGPQKIGRHDHVTRPVMLNCMTGIQWEGSVGVSFEMGVGVEFKAGLSTTGGEAKKEVSGINDPEEEEEKKPAVVAEIAAASLSFKAGLEASASYTYTNFYGEDPLPLYFIPPAVDPEGSEPLQELLGAILEEGSVKSILKRETCEFVTRHGSYFGGPLSYDRWFGHTSSSTIVTRLETGIQAINAKKTPPTKTEERVRALGEAYAKVLRLWSGDAALDGLTLIRISCHAPKGAAALKASAKAEASACGLIGASVGAEVTALGIEASAKKAYIRFQHALATKPITMCTQDTAITYSQVNLKTLFLSFEAKANVLHKDWEYKKEGGGEFDLLNRMTYESAIVYWDRPAGGGPASREVPVLPGSGLAFGETCIVKNLYNLIHAYAPSLDEPATLGDFTSGWALAYATSLAKQLHVTVPQLMAFIADEELQMIVTDLYNQGRVVIEPNFGSRQSSFTPEQLRAEKARIEKQYGLGKDAAEKWENKGVLVEATFALPTDAKVTVNHVTESRSVGRVFKSTVTDETYALAKDTPQKLAELRAFKDADARRPLLQSIRLRYRILDLENKDKTRFTLGLKIAGTGFGISLNSVDRAGSEGIIDLATVWMDEDPTKREAKQKAADKNPASIYEGAVPPVILFCQ